MPTKVTNLFAPVPLRHENRDMQDKPSFKALERRALLSVANKAAHAAYKAKLISEDATTLIRASRQNAFDKTEDLPALRETLAELKAAVESIEAAIITVEELEQGVGE